MAKCWVCGEQYYNQTTLDPEEPCWCGEMTTHITWEPFGERVGLFWKHWKYTLAKQLFDLGTWLTRRKQ